MNLKIMILTNLPIVVQFWKKYLSSRTTTPSPPQFDIQGDLATLHDLKFNVLLRPPSTSARRGLWSTRQNYGLPHARQRPDSHYRWYVPAAHWNNWIAEVLWHGYTWRSQRIVTGKYYCFKLSFSIESGWFFRSEWNLPISRKKKDGNIKKVLLQDNIRTK